MTGVGARYVLALAQRVLGDGAETWLDAPTTGIGDTPDVPVAPRTVIESGCPACVATVVAALEAITP